MKSSDYNATIMKKICPHCGFDLDEYKPNYLICNRCERHWEIIGGFPNGVPCEEK